MFDKLRLILIIVFRNLREEKLFSIISIFGVALGVGLFLSILSSTQSAIESMTSDIKKLNPIAKYEIKSKFDSYINENILEKLYEKNIRAYPVIRIDTVAENDLIVPVIGIDTLKILKNGNFEFQGASIDLQSFFENIDAAVLTEDIANRLNVKKGDIFYLTSKEKLKFTVAGILQDESIPSGVYQDIGNFQEKFKISGKISKIDVDINEADLENVKNILDNDLQIFKKSSLVQNQTEILKSFKMNLYFISFIAFLVGFFMLFNTIFITVVKKREQIGTLRALGASKPQILMIFVTQSLLLGVIGSISGVFLGQFVSIYSFAVMEDTISTIFKPVYIKNIFVFNKYTIYSVVLGVIISLFSSIFPSIEATKVRPTETIRKGTFELKFRKYFFAGFILGVILIFSGIMVSFIDYKSKYFDQLYLSYLGVFLILLGFCAAAFFYLEKLLVLLEKTIKRFFKTVGIISFADIYSSSYRFAIALISVSISTALIISMVTLIDSFKTSLSDWIDDNLRADIFIKSSSCSSNFCFEPLEEDVLQKIKTLDEVEAVSTFRAMPGTFKGKNILFGFGEERVVKKHHDGIENFNVTKSVAISEYLKVKYGIDKGDYIDIDTPKGTEKFKVREVFTSYSTTNGFIIFDNSFQKKYWGELKFTQISIYLKKGANPDNVIAELEDLINKNKSLDIYNNLTIRQKVIKIFDKSFAITYAIQLIALIVSLLGVGNMLYAVSLERRKEISILKYLGSSNKLLVKIYTFSATVIGILGTIYGSIPGGILSIIIIRVVNTKSFGWTIEFDVRYFKLFILLLILIIFVSIAGFLPVRTFKKVDPKKFTAFE
ncbi:MAG: putative transport system permease protein [Deferribacteres bacterium]|nr:putative transport system permease protein [Deferribacteres bacterium]